MLIDQICSIDFVYSLNLLYFSARTAIGSSQATLASDEEVTTFHSEQRTLWVRELVISMRTCWPLPNFLQARCCGRGTNVC